MEIFFKTDVLVVGGGLAGLRAALAASHRGASVIVIYRGKGASPGIIGFDAAVGDKDSVDTFYNDILKSGLGLCDKKLARILAKESVQAVEDLEKLGLSFDKKDSKYHLLQPLGCSYPRVVHYKNLTGIQAANLMIKQLKKNGVKIIDGATVTDLLIDEDSVIGVCGINQSSNSFFTIKAGAVVLAIGGCGSVYPFTTYPADITGDGYAMAYLSGAELIDMEFMAFESCGFVFPNKLRGKTVSTTILMEGGQLLNSKGERFMLRYNPERVEKVQKDELARAVYQEIMEGRGTKHRGVYLDVSMLPRDTIVYAHSLFYQFALKAGVDLTKDQAEVAPIAHTSIGGVKINEECMTTVAGLYAAGEVVGGIHGANRLGGSAGTETLVFGARAGKFAAEYALNHSTIDVKRVNKLASGKIAEIEQDKNNKNNSIDPKMLKKEIHRVMEEKVSIVKNGDKLKQAKNKLAEIKEKYAHISLDNIDQLTDIYEIRNMLITAEILIMAAIYRRESRGVHFREDYPQRDDMNWLKKIVIRKCGDSMDVAKEG